MNLETKLAGYYKLEIGGADRPRRIAADWFPNLITDQGLDYMATNSSRLGYCQVGSGSSAPSNSDTQLSSRIAGTSTTTSVVSAIQPSEPYYASRTITYSFSAGVAAGNISEVGVGAASAGSLFSRALVLDGSGNPTSITVLSDEVLYVTYQLRYYVPTVDSSGTVNISGVNYSWVGRARLATSSDQWLIGMETQSADSQSSNGTISVITGDITGTTSAPTSNNASPYVNGSHSLNYTLLWGLTKGNLSGGISAIASKCGNASYQIGFSPAIPKDSTKTLSIVLTHSWSRA